MSSYEDVTISSGSPFCAHGWLITTQGRILQWFLSQRTVHDEARKRMKEGQQSAAPKPPNLSEAPASILGRLAGIWRYPVMGLQGEMLPEAEISRQGVVGDHVYVVRDRRTGSILDPKSYVYSWGETSAMLRLIEIKAELLVKANGADEVRLTLPDGKVRSSDTGELGQALSKALSRQVEVVKHPRIVESILSGRTLHLLTTASLASMKGFYPSGDFDLRRFRPDILVESGLGEGFVEEGWLSCTVTVGDGVRLKVEKPNMRCVVTALRQGGLKEDTWILDSIEKHNQKKLRVMCSVSVGGVVRIGDGIGLVQQTKLLGLLAFEVFAQLSLSLRARA